MSAPRLYELVAQHRELQLVAEDAEADPQAVLDTIEGLEGEIELKSQSVAAVILNIESVADAIDEAAKAMKARAHALRNRAEGIRLYLQVNLQAAGITRVECPYFVIALRQNPPRVEVTDFEAVPDRYKSWPEPPAPSVDKRRALEAIKQGTDVPGVQVVRDNRLDIRQ